MITSFSDLLSECMPSTSTTSIEPRMEDLVLAKQSSLKLAILMGMDIIKVSTYQVGIIYLLCRLMEVIRCGLVIFSSKRGWLIQYQLGLEQITIKIHGMVVREQCHPKKQCFKYIAEKLIQRNSKSNHLF